MAARVITGIVGIPVVIGLTYLGGVWLELAVLLVLVVASVESAVLLRGAGYPGWGPLVVVGGPLVFLLAVRPATWLAGPALLLLATASSGLVRARRGPTASMLGGMGFSFFMALYLGLAFSFWIHLRQLPDGFMLVLAALLVTWANDTAAFFTGMGLGRRKLAPLISPGKTVEGAIGGIAGAGILGASAAGLFGVHPLTGLGVGVLGAVFAQAGDLFVSALKRSAGLKDSGRTIPGHGGVLDRFDSLSFVMPLFYYLFTSGFW